MKKFLLVFLFLFALIENLFFTSVQAADQTKLKLPWDVLEKILKLNQDTVRLKWEEFQILLAHTSSKKTPTFSTSNGEVVLSKEEFRRLVDNLLPPTPEALANLLTTASYKSRLKKDSVFVDATLQLHLRNKAGKLLQVDLFPADVAFHEILLDNKPALTEQMGGRIYLTTDLNGSHVVTLKFSVKIPEEKGRQSLSFSIPQTPITIYELEIPDGKMDVFVNQALSLNREKRGNGTYVKAILSPTTGITASWNPEVASEQKGPAQIYSDSNHLVSIEEDAIRVYSVLNLQVLKNSINSLLVKIPKGFNVIEVKGNGVGDWEEKGSEEKILRIPFEHAVTGFATLHLTTEQILTENKVSCAFSGLTVKDAIREKGFVGVELRTSAEAQAGKDLLGLERVDIQELPVDLVSASERPLLFGYRYLRPPYNLILEIERHPDIQLLSSVIDNASGISWLNEDGKLMHQITYRLRNMGKQFLDVQLPKGAQLWSVFVEGRPAKPSEGSNGKLLVPLSRSQNTGRGLSSFDVEITYVEEGFKTIFLGRHSFQFPVPDMMISRLNWTFFLPKDHLYHYFGRDLEVQKNLPVYSTGLSGTEIPMSAPVPALRLSRNKKAKDDVGKVNQANRPQEIIDELSDLEKSADSVQQRAEEMSISSELNASGSITDGEEQLNEPLATKSLGGLASGPNQAFKRERVAGVLPIRVHLPIMGEELRFTKALVLKEVPVQMSLYYFSDFLVGGLKLIFLAILGAIGFRKRKFILKALTIIKNKYRKSFGSLKPNITPFGWVVLSTLFCLCVSYFGWVWTAFSVVIFLIAVARWLLTLVRIPEGGIS